MIFDSRLVSSVGVHTLQTFASHCTSDSDLHIHHASHSDIHHSLYFILSLQSNHTAGLHHSLQRHQFIVVNSTTTINGELVCDLTWTRLIRFSRSAEQPPLPSTTTPTMDRSLQEEDTLDGEHIGWRTHWMKNSLYDEHTG